MVVFNECAILFVCEVLAIYVGKEREILCTVVEIGLRKHTVVHEKLQVVPLLFVFLAVLFEYSVQAVSHFLGDVSRYFLHVGIALQVAAAYVQRYIRRVYDTME